nr:hypothetical protein [uncultured Rhodopila sp.]
MNISIEDARRVKSIAGATARRFAHVIGVGLTKVGGSYAIKVNLADPLAIGVSLPAEIEGVPVVYEVTGLTVKQVAS